MISGGGLRARDVVTYQNLMVDLVFILRGLTVNLSDHVNNILISEGEELYIEQEQARLIKKQNMLRHIDISNDLVEELLAKIVNNGTFSEELHPEMFKEVSRFLFMYCYDNPAN